MDKIEIKNLTAVYNNKNGIKDINFKITKAEFIALLGHNGAGKTTLLNTLVGIKDYIGDIILDYKYNDIAYVSQKQVIDWYLDVENNIKMEEIFTGRKNNELFNKIVNLLDLKNTLKNPIEEMSGGQLQRVQIARAFLKNPKLYILDEPTTGLDVYSSENVMKYLEEEVNKGKIVIVSSHDLELIQKFCKRVIYIKEGNINFDGNITEFIQDDTLRNKILKELSYE